MKQVLIDNFAKATPGANDPTPANKLAYRLYVSQSPNMTTVTDVLTNGELIEEKIDADSFTWVTDQSGTWYFQIAVVSPIGGISIYESVASILLDEAVTGITVTPDPILGVEGNTVQLSISVQTAGGADDSYTVSVADETVATINSTDLLSLLVPGTTSITVTSVFDSNVTETVGITVAEEPEVTGITVSPSSINDIEGTTHPLTIEVLTLGGASNSYTITTSDALVATVDGNDVATLEGAGTATITLISDFDNSITETVAVTSAALTGTPFRLLVDTEESGITNNSQFEITGAQGSYLAVYDGKTEHKTGEQTLTFTSPGQNIVELYGGLERVKYNNSGDAGKILELQSWGDIVWQDFNVAFGSCTNMVVTATTPPDLSQVGVMRNMFLQNRSFVPGPSIEGMDVSLVNDLQGVFEATYPQDPNTLMMDLTGWTFRDDLSTAGLGQLNSLFRNSGINIESYNKFLISQANKVFAGSGPLNVSMTKQDSCFYDRTIYAIAGEFDNAIDARNYLIGTANWDITGDAEAPTVIDPSISINNLDVTGGDLAFQKATGSNAPNYVYTVYTGGEAELSDVSTIETQLAGASGTDVATLALTGAEGEFINYNVLVSDLASGIKRIYTPGSVLIPEQEISDVEIYEKDPAVFTSEVPIASFQNGGSLDLSSEQETIRLHAKVSAFDGADDTVTWSTSDATKVSITVIDDYTADINYVTSQPGDVVTITATSDFDSFFKADLDVNLFADSAVVNTESTTFELQT